MVAVAAGEDAEDLREGGRRVACAAGDGDRCVEDARRDVLNVCIESGTDVRNRSFSIKIARKENWSEFIPSFGNISNDATLPSSWICGRLITAEGEKKKGQTAEVVSLYISPCGNSNSVLY